jgi:hypothetical protein
MVPAPQGHKPAIARNRALLFRTVLDHDQDALARGDLDPRLVERRPTMRKNEAEILKQETL